MIFNRKRERCVSEYGLRRYRLTKYSDCLDGGRRRGVMNIRGQRGITSNRVRAKGSHAVSHELGLCCVIRRV